MTQSTIDVRAEVLPGEPFRTEREPDTCALVIFGITGDLSSRKLVPALYNLARERRLPEGTRIIGVGRRKVETAEMLATMRAETEEHSRSKPVDDGVWDGLAGRFDYLAGDMGSSELYERLRERLGTQNGLFYLAVPADVFAVVLTRLHEGGLLPAPKMGSQWARVMIEKPFGHDFASARELNGLIASQIDERQVFRLDHYLGKETVQNILVFRFGNSIFEPIWSRKYIDHVQITAAESIDIEGRGAFYDKTGVVRDIIQNHLLQVLTLCAMEPPTSFRADDVRDEKVQVLRSTRGIAFEDVVLGQYRGYREEKDVARDSRTPTFVALKLMIDNWRWQGVPFYLRAGKAMTRRVTEVAIQFGEVPLCLFGHEEACQRLEPDVLTIRIQPDEGIELKFMSKVPGEDVLTAAVTMDFSYERAFGQGLPEAYERLLLDGMRGDMTLFARRDFTEISWGLITPVLDALERGGRTALHTYEKGSAGPQAADGLLNRDRRAWRRLG